MSIFSLMRTNVHNAQRLVKAKCTPLAVQNAQMRKKAADEVLPDQAIRLRQAREARGFPDAKAAAKFFGFVYDTYAQHENGNRGIRRAVAERYGKAYGVSPAWLLTGEGTRVAAVPTRPIRHQRQQQPNRREVDDLEWFDDLLNSLTPDELTRAKTLFYAAFPHKGGKG